MHLVALAAFALAGERVERSAAELWKLAAGESEATEWADPGAWLAYRELQEGWILSPTNAKGTALALRRGTRSQLYERAGRELEARADKVSDCRPKGRAAVVEVTGQAGEEILHFWPDRASLTKLATIATSCGGWLGLTRTGSTWRIAAVGDEGSRSTWQEFIFGVQTDVPAQRARDRQAALDLLPKATVERWAAAGVRQTPGSHDDLDGDGLSDLVVSGVGAYWSAAGKYAELPAGFAFQMVPDADGDGRAELLAVGKGGAALWLGGDAERAVSLQGAPSPDAEWAAADLDGSGLADVLALDGETLRVWFDAQPNVGGLIRPGFITRNLRLIGDLDGDGADEVSFGNAAYNGGYGFLTVLHGGRSAEALRFDQWVGKWLEGVAEARGARLVSEGAPELVVRRWRPIDGEYEWGVQRRETWTPLTGAGARGKTTDVPPLFADVNGDGIDERIVSEGTALRVVASGGEHTVKIGAGATFVGVAAHAATGPALAVSYRGELRLMPVDGTYAGTVHVPLSPAEDANFAIGTIGGQLASEPPPGGASAKTVHWSEVMVKKRVTPKPLLGLEPGEFLYCTVRFHIDQKGTPTRIERRSCPAYAFSPTEQAALEWRFYPLKGQDGPIAAQFDMRFVYKSL